MQTLRRRRLHAADDRDAGGNRRCVIAERHVGASGGVGVCCVQLAKLAGATVIATTSSAEKANRLRALGADDVIDYAQEDFVQAVYARYGKPARRGPGSEDRKSVV